MGEIESVAIASTPIGKKADATDNQADRMKKVRCEKTTDRGMKEANRQHTKQYINIILLPALEATAGVVLLDVIFALGKGYGEVLIAPGRGDGRGDDWGIVCEGSTDD